jgi:predicted metal-dependent TIM-barrel fold hydrolase
MKSKVYSGRRIVIIIEPHIHMYSRTTDDYQKMYKAGIRACVEPSFWMGADRRYAGTFFDYFKRSINAG